MKPFSKSVWITPRLGAFGSLATSTPHFLSLCVKKVMSPTGNKSRGSDRPPPDPRPEILEDPWRLHGGRPSRLDLPLVTPGRAMVGADVVGDLLHERIPGGVARSLSAHSPRRYRPGGEGWKSRSSRGSSSCTSSVLAGRRVEMGDEPLESASSARASFSPLFSRLCAFFHALLTASRSEKCQLGVTISISAPDRSNPWGADVFLRGKRTTWIWRPPRDVGE